MMLAAYGDVQEHLRPERLIAAKVENQLRENQRP